MRVEFTTVGVLMLFSFVSRTSGQSPVSKTSGQSQQPWAVARSRTIPVHYTIGSDSAPLTRVELWYTVGDDRAWHRYGEDDDLQSPFNFTAPAEGAFGLFIVATNSTGDSSPSPGPKTQPHQRLLVDYTPPVVQMPQPRVEFTAQGPVVHLRWTALDAHWGSRPIEIAFRRGDEDNWRPVDDDRLSNAGQYDWRVPDEVTGVILVRVSAWDRAGNRGEAVSEPVDLAPTAVEPSSLTGSTNGLAHGADASPRDTDATRLARLNDQVSRIDSVAYGQAAAKLRDLLRRSPTDASAIADVGGALYALGDHDRALEAYDLALQQDARLAPALIGAARIRAERNDFASAATLLESLLQHESADGLGWLALGDVRLKQGDDLAAQQCYRKAAASKTPEIVQQARRRLDDMDALRRRLDNRAGPWNAKEP